MLESIKYNFANLANLEGRDARQTFWFWVLFLVIAQFALSTAITMPMMMGSMATAFNGAMAGASEAQVTARVIAEMADMMVWTLWLSVALNVLLALLLIAAFVRRLHDSDHSGWWVLIPLVTHLAATLYTVTTIDDITAMVIAASDPQKLEEVIAANGQFLSFGLIGYVAIIAVIGFGVLKSSDGPNRFGAEPVAF